MEAMVGNTSLLIAGSVFIGQPDKKTCYFFNSVKGDFDNKDATVSKLIRWNSELKF